MLEILNYQRVTAKRFMFNVLSSSQAFSAWGLCNFVIQGRRDLDNRNRFFILFFFSLAKSLILSIPLTKSVKYLPKDLPFFFLHNFYLHHMITGFSPWEF